MTPDDRKYAKTHEWIKIEGDLAVVGITDHAQEALGDLTFVECPAVGRNVAQGDECGVVESVKAATDLYAPVAGEIAEVNGNLEEKPELVNQDPYEKGWIWKLKNIDVSQLESLLDAARYEASLQS